MRGLLAIIPALLLMLVPISPAPAQSTDAGPALGVARISLINGDVTTKRGDSGDWVAAQVNEPVVEGDIIETAPGSRMELQLDYANIIRLDGATSVEIAELGNRRFRVRLLEGRITYSELKNGEADIDIETPLVAVRPRQRGRYEVAVQGDETIVVVRRGKTEIASINGIETLDNGRMMIIRDNGTGPEFRVERASGSDDWDDWNRSRDDRLSDVRSYQYVSEDIVGAGDLDDHGDWTYVSGYGHCWYPRGVDVGWAPYRHGRWLWSGYYGWTWAGYEPWGWAPYHYGRWFYTSGRGWGWWPGYRHHRHFYRPALVSFFGYGGGRGFSFGVGIGFGNVGWVALAPGERYRPWYGRGYYGRRGGNQTIIVDNSVNIYNNYRNARAHNGVTVVDANGFSRGQVNNPRSLRGDELQRASLVRGQIPVAPARESQGRVVRASARGNNSVAARAASVRTYSRGGGTAGTRSARLERTSFDQQRQQVVSSVRSFQQDRSRNVGAKSGSVRANSGAAMSGADSRSQTTVRGGAAGTTSVSRSGKVATSSVRSRPANTSGRSSGWRSLGDRSATTQRSSRSTVTTQSSSRVNRSATTRSGSSRSSAIPQRSTSRVNRSSTGRSSSGSWSSRSNSRSAARATIPQRSSSRVQRSSQGSSRVNRAPTSSRSSSSSRMSTPSRPSRSSGSYNRGSVNRSSGRSSVSRAPRVSSPSRSSAPRMQSAPSRSSGAARSGGSVRSAPSRGRSGRSK